MCTVLFIEKTLVSKNITPVLNEILRSAMKYIYAIKANAKCERLYKQCRENENADYVRLLLHTLIRWFPNRNWLKRFIDLCDVLFDTLRDKPEMKHLLTVNGKALVRYLTDIFEKLNMLNK